jgi:transcriptional regulator with XRE-family HTH domain
MSEKTKAQELGHRLKVARVQAGLTQEQAATLLKVPRPSISEMENGRRSVSGLELKSLSDTYGVSLEWLLQDADSGQQLPSSNFEIAARELKKLKEDDLNKLINFLHSIKGEKSGK